MRLHHCLPALFLILCVMVLIPTHTVHSQDASYYLKPNTAQEENDAKILNSSIPARPVPSPLQLVKRDATYDAAYRDTYSILSANNPCSSFFGGNVVAVEVLNQLAGRLEKKQTQDRIGITMSGEREFVRDNATGASYRLFKHAVINSNGPFYRKKLLGLETSLSRIGSFQPNTREARVLIILHELAHLMKGQNGHWLIPDDGNSTEQSIRNTQIVETRCGENIKELRSSNTAKSRSLKWKQPDGGVVSSDDTLSLQP